MPATLDAHATPPQFLRDIYKKYQKCSLKELELDGDIIDLQKRRENGGLEQLGAFSPEELQRSIEQFLGHSYDAAPLKEIPVYGHPLLPGLRIVPDAVPEEVQIQLLSRIFHRDLSNPSHKTNLHLHYNLPYGRLRPDEGHGSFFDLPRSHEHLFLPKDASLHKPLSISQVLDRKLRWMTLGGQYDWTQKVYPDEQPPPFPPDISQYLEGFFADMKAQAAIVNVYSPGDTLSLHRDVSEQCDRGLISLSMGCDGIFVIGLETNSSNKPCGLAFRVRAGDLLYMDGEARFAWHGVPRILADTGPAGVRAWPCLEDGTELDRFQSWKGWMPGKRINLNVRQMWED